MNKLGVLVHRIHDASHGDDAPLGGKRRLPVVVLSIGLNQTMIGLHQLLGQLQCKWADVVSVLCDYLFERID